MMAGRVQSLRAIEALRAGVPNRDAVRALGSSQPQIESTFYKLLQDTEAGLQAGQSPGGILVAGGFGTGKTHLLEYLQHLALERNFVCSRVVVSKETPLFDPLKVFTAAMESVTVPDRTGSGLNEVARKVDFSGEDYQRFYRWVSSPESGICTWFPATVYVYEYSRKSDRDIETADRIIRFWSGEPLSVSVLRGWLRELDQGATYRLGNVSVGNLAQERYKFAPRLMLAAGYKGWVLFVDEVELIGRYTLMQRARSYAAVAQLLGKLTDQTIPGVATVLTITDDFEGAVLDDPRRNDEERIPNRLRATGNEARELLASQAERGMRLIRQSKLLLDNNLSPAKIAEIRSKVSQVYADAYQWQPPESKEAADHTAVIRQHIKRWINTWDLERLYPGYRPDIEVSELRPDYSELPELEMNAKDDPPADSGP
jgi:hypothetical protein